MYAVILDENLVKIDQLHFEHDLKINNFKKIDNIPDIDNVTKDVLNSFNYFVGVCAPSENLKDFYISFLNKSIINMLSLDFNNIIGINLSDIIYNENQEKKLLYNIHEVYTTGIPQQLFCELYEKDVLYRRFDLKITKIDGFIYFIFGDMDITSSDLDGNLFENDVNAITVVQDGRYVKINNQFIKYFDSYKVEGIIGEKIGSSGLIDESIKYIKEIGNKILTEKLSSFTFPLKVKKDDKLLRYFKITSKYIIYNNKPAVLNIYNDITQQELNRNEVDRKTREALFYQDNLDLIQSISDTGFSYQLDNKILRSSKIYDIIEREPLPDDVDRDILLDFVIDEDKHIVEENYAKFKKEYENLDFIIRINTAKGNRRYIHCYLRLKSDDEETEKKEYIRTLVAYDIVKNENKMDSSRVDFYKDISNDIEQETKLEDALKESLKLSNNLDRIQAASKTAIGYTENLQYSKWTPEIYDILEINKDDYTNDTNNIIKRFVVDEDIDSRKENIAKLSRKHPEVTFNQRIITGKGNLKYIKTVIHQEYDEKGNLIDCVSFNQDITPEIKYQNQLKDALNDKELLLTDKEMLLSEVHHRVKNNLQIILSLINLNRNFETDPDSILSNTENRIYAMALLHEKIYGSLSLSDVNIKDYIESLVTSLFDMYESNIQFHSDMQPHDIDMEQAIPLGLIVNELVNNTIKYAFPDKKEGNVYISFKKEDKHCILTCEDDGIGLPNDFDLDNLTGLGLIVVQNLTLQIGGTMSIIDCKGTGFKIEFDEE